MVSSQFKIKTHWTRLISTVKFTTPLILHLYWVITVFNFFRRFRIIRALRGQICVRWSLKVGFSLYFNNNYIGITKTRIFLVISNGWKQTVCDRRRCHYTRFKCSWSFYVTNSGRNTQAQGTYIFYLFKYIYIILFNIFRVWSCCARQIPPDKLPGG